MATPWTAAPRLLCPWDSPGKSTGVGSHALLQMFSSTQGSNPHLLQWQVDSLPLSPEGSPCIKAASNNVFPWAARRGGGSSELHQHPQRCLLLSGSSRTRGPTSNSKSQVQLGCPQSILKIHAVSCVSDPFPPGKGWLYLN